MNVTFFADANKHFPHEAAYFLCNNRHLLSLSTFRKCIYNFSQVSAESMPHVLWFLLQVGVNKWKSAQMRGCIKKNEYVSQEITSIIHNSTPLWLAMGLPKGSRPSSTALPGLWWAISRHWLSCKPWEEMNIECQVSISLRWLGTSGLKMITTPLESFMSAGQHDSNL